MLLLFKNAASTASAATIFYILQVLKVNGVLEKVLI